jgi:hypothetical protein
MSSDRETLLTAFPWRYWTLYLCLSAALLGSVAWDATEGQLFLKEPTNYYGWATDAALNGQLSLRVQPRPEIAALSNPYDSALNQPYRLHDVSYLNGQYYFYWGLSPVVLFFAPVRLLFGAWPTEAVANAVFGTMALAAWAWFILSLTAGNLRVRRPFVRALVLVALWACSLLPMFSGFNRVYGVPISCAAAMFAVAACALLNASRRNWSLPALVAAGVCLALAIGARPNYLLWAPLCGVVLLPQLLAGPTTRKLSRVVALAGPPILAVAALLFMNWQRFGRPLEFGLRYQLAGASQFDIVLFSPVYVAKNAVTYLLHVPELVRYFPFVRVNGDEPFGVISTFPVVLLIGLAWWKIRRQAPGAVVLAISVAAVAALGSACLFVSGVQRYMVDFLPSLVALGGVGAIAAARETSRLTNVVIVFLLGVSSAAGLCIQLKVWSLGSPERESALANFARIPNRAVYFIERLGGKRFGALQLEVLFPGNRAGAFEPLVQIPAREGTGELVFIHYVDTKSVQLGVFQTGTTHWLSEPIAVDYSRPHKLEIRSGSLLPPPSHPMFRSWPEKAVDLVQQRFELHMDGRRIFVSSLRFDRNSVEPVFGTNVGMVGVSAATFSGKIHRIDLVTLDRPEPPLAGADLKRMYGPWQLRVQFPKDAPPTHHDPILVSGVAGKGDFVYAFYPAPGQVAFGLDSWGRGGATSEIVSVDLDKSHVLVIEHGGLFPPLGSDMLTTETAAKKGRIVVVLDGVQVLDGGSPTYDAAPDTVTCGENLIGGSSTAPKFLGKILESHRLDW